MLFRSEVKPPEEDLPEEKFPEEAKTKLAALRAAQKKLQSESPPLAAVMGVAEAAVEDTRIHVRGSHLILGKTVPRGVPAVLELGGPLAVPAEASGRRELADWLVDPRHPLTARVFVNRVWQQFFGIGLVKTVEDFGVQGEPPPHRAVLDWLAVRFRERWDVKGLVRDIVTTAAYRRASRVAPAALAADPDNRLFARGPRFRL